MSAHRKIDLARVVKEVVFTASRSGGAGGQNVNKVNTKVTLKFDVAGSQVLQEEEKAIVLKKLASRLTKEGILVLVSQDARTQFQNKEKVIQKFEKLMIRAFEKRKVRKPTKPTKASSENRIEKKKQQGEKKKWRRKLP